MDKPRQVLSHDELLDLHAEAFGQALLDHKLQPSDIYDILHAAKAYIVSQVEEAAEAEHEDVISVPETDPEDELRNALFNFSVHLVQCLQNKYNVNVATARQGVATYLIKIATGLQSLNEEQEPNVTTK